jgi:hypothetical protein
MMGNPDSATIQPQGADRHRYWCAGFDVVSTRPLPGAASQAADMRPAPHVDVDWVQCPPPAQGGLVFAWPGRFGLRLHRDGDTWAWSTMSGGVATWRADVEKDHVRCFAQSPDTTALLAGVLVRRILPRLAARRGRLVMHAAACANAHGAVLIAGTSGAGKSTLATALHHAGAPLFGDDLSTLTAGEHGVACLSSASGACLWPDALAAVGRDASSSLVPGYDHKHWCTLSDPTAGRTPIVRQVWLLARGGDASAEPAIACEPLSRGEAMTRLWRLVVPFYPRDVESLETSWRALAVLVDTARVAVLHYPSGFDRLPDVAQELVRRLADRS